jgi:hypothetical protein
MTATLTERLGALGDLALTHSWDPEVFAACECEAHQPLLRIWWGEKVFATLVITRRGGDARTGITLGGRDPRILLEGELIEVREYVAGTTLLSNGNFALLDPAQPTHALHWVYAEGTSWQVTSAFGPPTASLNGSIVPTKDDVLPAEEQPPAVAGQTWEATADVSWPLPLVSPAGKLHLRLEYFGHFDAVNQISTFSGGAWTLDDDNYPVPAGMGDPHSFTIVNDPTSAYPGDTSVLKAQTRFPLPQLVENPNFSAGFTGWRKDGVVSGPVAAWVVDTSAAPDLPTSVHLASSGFILTDVNLVNTSPGLATASPELSPGLDGFELGGTGIPPNTYFTYLSSTTGNMTQDATADVTGGSVSFRPQTTKHRYLWTDADPMAPSPKGYPVAPGETWNLYATVSSTDGAMGTAAVYFVRTQSATADHPARQVWEQAGSLSNGNSNVLTLGGPAVPPLREIQKDTTMERETTALGAVIEIVDARDGVWWFSNVLLQRVKGNSAGITDVQVAVTAERTYRWTQPVRSGPAMRQGSVCRLTAAFDGPGRPTVIVSSQDQGPTGNKWLNLTLDVTPPSGYDRVTRRIEINDVFDDWFYFGDKPTFIDQDRTTRIYDLVAVATGPLAVSAVAPVGTEKVGVSLVAEAGAYSWDVADVDLHRINEPIPTAAQVVTDLLRKTDGSGDFVLLPGNIIGTDTLLHDWPIRYISQRTSLVQLSTSGLVDPLREDRVNPDLTYDWGTAEQLYRARPNVILTNTRVIVLGGVAVARNSETKVDQIIVLGATKTTAAGRPVQIIGRASNGPTGQDWQGKPVLKTQVVDDASADTIEYANALARYRLDQTGTIVNVTATLADWRTVGDFDCGDWLFPENRDADLEDTANGVELGTETAFPKQERCLARTTRMGKGSWRAEVLRPGKDPLPLPMVGWENETTCSVELGTPLPNFIANLTNPAATLATLKRIAANTRPQ